MIEGAVQEAARETQGNVSRRRDLIRDGAVLITAFGGFLTFAGVSYYESLFRNFALRPGILEISQADLVAHGFWAAFYAAYSMVTANIRTWTKAFLLGLLIAVILCAPLTYYARSGARSARADKVLDSASQTIKRHTSSLLRYSFILIAATTGLVAGTQAGNYQAELIKKMRRQAPNCFVTGAGNYRGVVLGQDVARTILVQSRSTRIIRNEDLLYVIDCKFVKHVTSDTATGNVLERSPG